MKHCMKRLLSIVMVAAFALLLSMGAFAVEDTGVSVQIGDQPVVFADAAPVIIDGHTFVPFRTVFETLGAEISYDEATQTVTAVRNATTVKFVIGQKSMKLTENGVSRTVEIDAAAFVRGGHTMVPARFAAQALGCSVGWDSAESTVLILDVESLLKQFDSNYTLMDKYLAHSRQLTEKPCAVSGTIDLTMKVADGTGKTTSVATNGTIDALYSRQAMNMELDMALDLDELLASPEPEDMDEQTQAMLSMLGNIKVEYIFNFEDGKLYMRSPLFSLVLGINNDAWVSLDLYSVYKQMGMDVSSLISASYDSASMKEFLAGLLLAMPLTNKAQTAALYAEINLLTQFSDDNFVKSGDTYTNTKTFTEDGTSFTMTLELTVKNDRLSGYRMDVDMKADSGNMSIKSSMDKNNRAVVNMIFSIPDVLEMTYDLKLDYEPTSQTPAGAPEEGSDIMEFPFPQE